MIGSILLEITLADIKFGGFHWLCAAKELLALEIEANECTL